MDYMSWDGFLTCGSFRQSCKNTVPPINVHVQLKFDLQLPVTAPAVRFNVVPKEDNPMVWKPNAVQLRQLKYSSCASYVDAEKLTASPALEVAACFN